VPSQPGDPGSPLVPTKSFIPLLQVVPGFDHDKQTLTLENRAVPVSVHDWEEPIDSANLRVEHWYKMAETIADQYHEFEGFVILHGTDTLAYSAAALSFLLENLSKPVVLTGSQRPLIRSRSDAIQNLVTSIEVAASKTLHGISIPEVCVFFRDTLTRGNRTTKTSANDFRAFSSPNLPPLAVAAKRIRLDWKQVVRLPRQDLRILPNLERKVVALDLFPGMSVELLQNLLSSPGLRGVVLKTFGAGNAPTHPRFLKAIRKASDKGILILDVTQCWSGEVDMGLYETSVKLLECGVVSGLDMVPEAGLAKMMAVLGMEENPDLGRDLLQINLRGEQAGSLFHLRYPGSGTAQGTRDLTLEPLRAMTLANTHFRSSRITRAFLRFFGVKIKKGTALKFRVSLFDHASGSLKLLGMMESTGRNPESTTMSLSVPVARLKFLRPTSNPNLVIEVESCDGKIDWEKVDLSLLTQS
jgi:L-asparaginase